MRISYNKLWKLLIDKGMRKTDLKNATGISSSTMAKLTKSKNVNVDVLMRICVVLKCSFDDIMEIVTDQNTVDVTSDSDSIPDV